jgi:purine-binding chemotaxis protein CheW
MDAQPGFLLLAQARTCVCALPLSHVLETLRPLPIQPVPVAPDFILGLSVIRGEPVPVVDLGRLLGFPGDPRPTRLVVIRVQERRAALAVEAVLRIVAGESLDRRALPPLLRSAGEQAVSAVSALDHEFLTILEAAHLVPEDVWGSLAAEGGRR